ncbi:5'-3' exoribonuclease 1 isoform X2 [Drosophila virilis]|uniref:5'-3' exoribonuclease 1 isoform X2 n=1 Tax=Drosophila virilis TaxID=7244 RepID=UPI00017D5929|nr:5'-3' exoribonuclease 1 isoform X2 [Drosophila virilis]
MGVPKFFRYISERYPCLSELAREHSIPEFDNLYLDMNGIVHNCSHPDDNNIHFHLEEPQIFQDIYNYIDKLFYLIKPQKLFFLAVDGVAPRAKMNQQRSRRFRSAREAEMLEAKALQRGERREHERFDSNCITPGTEFMARLQLGLRCFLRTKISTDPLWQKCRIILSGQETPGEGEHKIMDYIRYMKAQPNFDPNTRHCLYGLDADLIILGLCTHELHFVVLREEVKFGRNVKRTSVEETRFFLLHLGLLREYLELEFHQLSTPEQKLDVAQLIDDWVLMGFMVGNDFIPHLPCLHISSNALPLLYKTYIRIYRQLGGNINEHGKLNLERLEQFMHALSEVELQLFEEHSDDLKYMNAKTEAFDVDVAELKNGSFDGYSDDLAALIDNSMKLYEGDSDEDFGDEQTSLRSEFQNYKRNYYRNKFKNEMHSDLIAELGYHYVTAMQWVLDYYYRGVQSWDWYYPYHYAPFISDLTNIKDIRINFKLGKPFLPFQQLLAVLPAASVSLLPAAYHDLMLNPNSPLAEFYPTEFESDLNGKKHDWEAVVLIPFIEEDRLLRAMSACEPLLNSEERNRNRHGPMFQYDYSAQSQGPMKALAPLKSLQHVFCTELARWAHEIAINTPRTVCVELPNAARHVFFPGFPTMKHLEFNFDLRYDRVKVFEQASRNQSMVLLPKRRHQQDTLTSVASQYLGQVVHIGWPHLIKAKVESVATRDQIVDKDGVRANESRYFESDCKALEEHFTSRMGIKFANYYVLVYIRTYAGSSVEFGQRGSIFMQDSWNSSVTPYPAQGVVSDITVRDNLHVQFRKIEQLFPVGSTVFFIGEPYAGSEGTVLDPMLVYSCGRVQVNLRVGPEPQLLAARQLQEQRDRDYMNSYKVCRELDITSKCLGRLTGTVWVVLGPRRERMENVSKHNIGLQLKYPRLNEERAGYCRRLNNQWFYSSLAIELMSSYCDRYPSIVDYFSSSSDRGEFIYEEDIFPDAIGQHHIEDVANWVRQQPHMKVDRITCGSRTVCKETVELLLAAADELRLLPVKNVKLQVKPHLLIKPNVTLPDVYRTPGAVRLFDRVVVVRTIYMVPVGITGTVIGIHPVSDPNPVRLECLNSVETFCELLFDRCVANCGDIHGIADERVYKVPESALVIINASDANEKQQPPPAQAAPAAQQPPSYQLKARTDAMRRDWREQQQPGGRFITAASSKYNAITMNTHIADEFYLPGASDASSSSAAGTQPSTSGAAARSSTAVAKKESQVVQNWRTMSTQAPLSLSSRSTPPGQEPGGVKQLDHVQRNQAAASATPHDQTQALKLLLGLKPPSSSQPSTAQQMSAAFPTNLPSQSHFQLQSQSQSLANVPSTSQQLPQAPLPSQMPKLPQPPLFWQREAQQQQAKLQSELLISTQQWDQGPLLSSSRQPNDEESPEAPAPSAESLMRQLLQHPQAQHQMQQQQQQQQQLASETAVRAIRTPQLVQAATFMPSGLSGGYNNSHQRYNSSSSNYYPINNNNNYNNSSNNSNNNNSNNNNNNTSSSSSSNNRPSDGNYYGNANPRRSYTSIQDFVPIQAYRPKKSQRNAQQMEKLETGNSSAANEVQLQEASGSATAQNAGDEASSELMRTLKITPPDSEASTSVAAVKTEEAAVIKPKVTRKPRVPRIGAKFDLEYIMP